MKIYLKKCLKIIPILVIIYFGLIILEYARQGFINDVSLQPVNIELNKSIKEPIYLISYADGKEYIFRNQHAMNHYAINKGIDFVLNYKRKHLDAEFVKKNHDIFNVETGAGLWLWKSYIILETMKHAPENSYIVYLDSNFKVTQHIRALLNDMDGKDVMLVHDRNGKNGQFVKGETFKLMNCTSEECRNGPHIWTAVIVVRNTKKARAIIGKWLESCQNIKALSPQYYGIAPNYPEFLWHLPEQAILSLVYLRNKSSIKLLEYEKTLPILSWFHRKNSKSAPNKIWYTTYGTDPLINLSSKGKTLPSSALLNTPPIVYLRKWWLNLVNYY